MKALELFRKDRGSYPTTAQGLKALVSKAEAVSEKDRGKKYLFKVPQDPWGHSYVYKCPGSGAGKPGPPHWKMYFGMVPQDLWHHDYVYHCPPEMQLKREGGTLQSNDDSYELISPGPDGIPSGDDIRYFSGAGNK